MFSKKQEKEIVIALIIIIVCLFIFSIFTGKLNIFSNFNSQDSSPSAEKIPTQDQEREEVEIEKNPEQEDSLVENEISKPIVEEQSDNEKVYQIHISSIELEKEEDYRKEEKIKIILNATIPSNLKISKVEVNGNWYPVTYQRYGIIFEIDGFKEAGNHNIQITKILLNSGKEIIVSEQISVSVQKNFPSTNYEYEYIEKSKELNIKLLIDDVDKAIANKIVIALKNENNELIDQKETTLDKLSITFENISFGPYLVEVKADIKLSEQVNISDYILGSGAIKLENRSYELKNIEEVNLYKKENGEIVKVNEDEKIYNSTKNNYLVELVMKNASNRYTTIKSIREQNGKIYLELDLENYIQYENGNKKNTVEITYPYEREMVESNDLIPNRIINHLSYDKNKEILYTNLYQLMPYYDSNYILEDGNQLSKDHILNQKEIKTILPFYKGKMVNYLSKSNYDKIDTIKIVFKDNTMQTYSVEFKSYISDIANYNIPELKTSYNYINYVIDENTTGFTSLVSMIQNYSFESDIYVYGKNKYIDRDKRLYFDHFSEFQKNPEEFILKLAANNSLSLYLDSSLGQEYAIQILQENHLLEQLLFTYNYIYKWYDFEVGGINLSDVLFFNDSMLKNRLNTIEFGSHIANNVGANMQNGDNTLNFYNTYLKNYTGLDSVSDFIEFFICNYAGYKDVNDWIVENFKGIAIEIPATYLPEKTRYRIWDYMKNSEYRGGAMILPILSLQSEDMYLLSVPTQLCIGSMKAYGEYNPNDPNSKEIMREKIMEFGKQVALFYDTTSRILTNGPETLNKVRNLQVDRRIINGVLQEAATTEDAIIKNIYVPLNIMPAANGTAAYANGWATFWNYQLLNCYNIFTHETAHNQDGRVFLEGNGRRWQGWAEDYADGNIAQGSSDGSINFNLSTYYNESSNVTSNLTPDRINSREKIGDYYKKMFETINTLDYLEARAFLQLSASDQSKVADQHYYPDLTDANTTDYNARVTSKWRTLNTSDFTSMNLQTIEDLWDNQIMLRPGNANDTSIGANRYGGESLYNVNWYQPHNDYGRPNSYAFKRLAFEMLGEAGYDGYIAYYSYQNKTDLDALRVIMKDETITWKDYKMLKYSQIEASLEKGSVYFDEQEVINMFIKSMQLDAADSNSYNNTYSTNLRNSLYHYLQRITNDFETGIYEQEEMIHIRSASEFISEMKKDPTRNFILDNDINFQGYSGTNSITDVTFMGHLDGNGYKIMGASNPIFTSVQYSYIENLILEQANISLNVDNVGILSKTSTRSIFTNIHLINSKVESKSRVGGLIGTASNSIIHKTSSNIDVIIKEDRGGSIVAEAEGTSIISSYSLGTVTQLSDAYYGAWHIGGLVGRISSNGGINGCYSATYIDQRNTRAERAAGGLFGKSEGNRAVINSFSVSNGINIYRFDGHSNRNDYKSGYYNNFEYEGSNGRTNQGLIDYDMNGIINVATKENLSSIVFFINQLRWDRITWNLDQLESGYLPTLNSNLDYNENVSLPEVPKEEAAKIEIIEIPPSKVEELENEENEEKEDTENGVSDIEAIVPKKEIIELESEQDINN